MKKLLPFLLAAMPFVLAAQNASPNLRLVGIVNVEGLKLAVLENSLPQFQTRREIMLTEGQRDGSIELVGIHSEKGTVRARVSGEIDPQVLGLKNQDSHAASPFIGLALEDADIQTILQLVGHFSGRTVLQHPGLPTAKFTLRNEVTNRAEAAQILSNALVEKQIALVPDGDNFLLVAPKAQASTLNPRSSQFQPATTNSAVAQLIPAGSINFQGALTAQVLAIYVEFRGDKLDRSSPLPATIGNKIFLKMETALTKEECLYALETLMNWSGIKLVPAENGLVKAAPVLADKSDRSTK